jgi:hypothetical protein
MFTVLAGIQIILSVQETMYRLICGFKYTCSEHVIMPSPRSHRAQGKEIIRRGRNLGILALDLGGDRYEPINWQREKSP